MSTTQTTSPFQIFNDGACIRIVNDTKTLLVTKEQVKTIDTIQNNVVRIDIGEGPLKNIFINYQDVNLPVVNSANELREEIKSMLLSDQYDGNDATEQNQILMLNKMIDLELLLKDIKQKEADLAEREPSRVDESNPYMVYRGWHKASGVPTENEWAIERIKREGDEIIHEWAFGTQNQVYSWASRLNHNYIPLNHITISLAD